MPIITRLDRVMADRKIGVNELSEIIGISPVNISRFRQGHIKAVRFSTIEAICEALRCQPGDLIEYVPNCKYPFCTPEQSAEVE